MSSDESLSLEKLKINERLHASELQLARLVAHHESEAGTFARFHADIMENIKRLETLIVRHDHILMGNGKPGVLMELDRLQTSENIRRWVLGIIGLTVIGILTKVVIDIIIKHGT